MGEPASSPCWLQIYATEIEPGDMIRFRPDGDVVHVADRDYPGVVSPIFRIRLPDGSSVGLAKLARIEVLDPGDGSVAERVSILPSR